MTASDYNEQFCRLMARSRGDLMVGKKLPRYVMREALALIEGGKLDYAWTNSNGQGLLGVMLDKVTGLAEREDLMCAMLNKGFNPLNGSDEELNLVFNNQVLGTLLIQFAAEQERRGSGLRTNLGGNIYHVMARVNCWTFGDDVEMMATNTPIRVLISHRTNPVFKPGELNPGRKERRYWLHQSCADGSTPLHVLWSPETLAYAVGSRDGFEAEKIAADINSVSVFITALLVGDIGLDLLTPNLAGIRALDLMEARNLAALYTLADDTLESGKLLDVLRADVQTRILERDTPVASGRKTGVRL